MCERKQRMEWFFISLYKLHMKMDFGVAMRAEKEEIEWI